MAAHARLRYPHNALDCYRRCGVPNGIRHQRRRVRAADDHQPLQQVPQRSRACEPVHLFVGMRREHEPAVDQLRQDLARHGCLPAQQTAPVIHATPKILPQPSAAEGLPRLRLGGVQRGDLFLETQPLGVPVPQRRRHGGNRADRPDSRRVVLQLRVNLPELRDERLAADADRVDRANAAAGALVGALRARHTDPAFISACLAAGSEPEARPVRPPDFF